MVKVMNGFMSWWDGRVWSSRYANTVFHSTREQAIYFYSCLICRFFPINHQHFHLQLGEGWEGLCAPLLSIFVWLTEYPPSSASLSSSCSRKLAIRHDFDERRHVLWHLWVIMSHSSCRFTAFFLCGLGFFSHSLCLFLAECVWAVCRARNYIPVHFTFLLKHSILPCCLAGFLQGSVPYGCVFFFFSACKS